MSIFDHARVRLTDVATVGRPRHGVAYPEGTITIQVSATNGQADILTEAREVEGKYAVIEPDRSKVVPDYLLLAIRMEMPSFLARYQTTINIQIGALLLMTLDVHRDLDTQRAVVGAVETAERMEALEERAVEMLKDLKRWHLDAMLV